MDQTNTYTVPRAAQLLNLTPQTLHSWRRKGWLVATQLPNGRYVVTADELARLTAKPGEARP